MQYFIKNYGARLAALLASAVFSAGLAFISMNDLRAQAYNGAPNDSAMDDEAPLGESSDLTIVQGTPTGLVGSAGMQREIVVMFSRPMVPLAALEKETRGAFTVSPKIKGKFRWYGSRVCAFIPEEGYPPAADFTVTVLKGVKSLDNKELKETYTFNFSTPRLKVTGVYSGNNFIAYDAEILVRFNLPVDIKDVKKYASVKSGKDDIPLRVEYAAKPDESNLTSAEIARRMQTFRLIPLKKYGRNEVVRVFISRHIKPAGGHTGLNGDYEKAFRTYGPLTASFEKRGDFFSDLYGYRLIFNNPVNYQELAGAARFEPAAGAYKRTEYASTAFSVSNWKLKPSTNYTVTFPNGLKDIYGNQLQDKNTTIRFMTPRRRRHFYTDTGFLTFESQMPHRVTANLFGVPELLVAVAPYGLNEVLDYADSVTYVYGLNVSYPFEKIWNLGIGMNDVVQKSYDIDPFIDGKTGWYAVKMRGSVENWRGDVIQQSSQKFIQITDLGVVVKESADYSDVWVHYLSSGLPAPKSTVTRYDGKSKDGLCITDNLGYCRINKELLLNRSQKKRVYVVNDGAQQAYILSNNDQVSMWGLAHNFDRYASLPVISGSIFFDRKLYRPGDKVFAKAFLGVRKNGKVYYTKNHLGNITAIINDSRGNVVLKKDVSVSDEGGVSLAYVIPSDSPLGHYSISFESSAINQASYYRSPFIRDTFQVEEFRPVSFSVSSSGFDDGFIGDKLSFSVEGKYLFGAPMQNAPVRYSVSRQPWNIYFENYAEYVFGDNDFGDRWEAPGWSYFTGQSSNLDKKGLFSNELIMAPMEAIGYEKDNLSRHFRLELEARVTDIDDKTVTHKKTVKVYAGKEIPGIKTKDRYQGADKTFEFDLLAISAQTKTPVEGGATVIIHRKEWHSIQTKGPANTSQRKNRLVRVEVLRKNIQLGKEPYRFTTKVSEPGNYTITLKMNNSMAYTRDGFYAFGGGYIGWDFHEDDTITLIPDKAEYKPGDKAKILIQSPFKKSTAIVTVERENVLWQKSFELTGNGAPLEIPILENYIPNVYVSVVLLRPRAPNEKPKDGKDVGKPMFKAGVVQLNVNTSAYRLPLEIASDRKIYGPGDDIEINIKTAPGAEVAVSVADRAVLDLVNYYFTDPVKNFYDKWPLGVAILENRHSIIEQLNYSNKGDAPGGKGLMKEKNGNGGFDEDSEDGMRKNFLQTAFWNEKYIADKQGNINIKFRLPHNLTTFRIMAAAARNGKYNSTHKEFQVQKPVVLQTSLPRFIRPTDSLQMGAVIVNQSGAAGKFKVTFESDLLTNNGNFVFEKIINLDNGSSGEVAFELQVDQKKYNANKRLQKEKYVENFNKSDPTGTGYDAFMAAGVTGRIRVEPLAGEFNNASFDKKHLKDAMVFRLPIRELPPREAFTIAGFTDSGETEMISIPEEGSVSPYYGGLEIDISSTALIGLSKGFQFYKSNPYFCLEQKSSAFLLALTSGELLKSFGLEPPAARDYDFGNIAGLLLEDLPKFQNSDGGFRLWKDDIQKISYPYLTAHVVFTLQVMKETGAKYEFPDAIYNKALRYLSGYMTKPPKDTIRYYYETMAFVNYVLARAGEGNTLYDRVLASKIKYLSLRSKAYLAMSMAIRTNASDYRKNEVLVKMFEEFKNRMQFTTRGIYFDEPEYGSYARTWYSGGSTLSALLRAFVLLDKNNPLIPGMVRAAIGEKTHAYWSDSHSTGLLAYGLWKYHKQYENTDSKMTANVFINNKNIFSRVFFGLGDAAANKIFSMEDILKIGKPGVSYPLEFKITSGKGRLYYTGSLFYSPLKFAQEARDEGIEIRREIFPLSNDEVKAGNTVKTFERGKAYLYRLTVINPKPVYYFVLTDPLPSNVEVVNTGFQTEGASFGRFLGKQRGGQNRYWWMNESATYEYRDDRVLVFTNYLSPGVHEYFYIARGISKGEAVYPAAEGFGMYSPEIFGRTGVYTHTVE